MEQAVAFMVGVSYLALGASLFLCWEDWSAWLKRLRAQGRTAALSIGALHLAVGTFILGFHWKWEGLPLLLTLLGVKAVMEGYLYTLCPNTMLAMLKWCEPRHRMLLRISGLLTIVIAALVLCEWQQLRLEALMLPPAHSEESVGNQAIEGRALTSLTSYGENNAQSAA